MACLYDNIRRERTVACGCRDSEAQPIEFNRSEQVGEGGRLLPPLTFTNPSWSPNGDYIAYVSFEGKLPGSNFRLWVVPADDLEAKTLLHESAFPIFSSQWSPDSRSIALVEDETLSLLGLDGQVWVLIDGGLSKDPFAVGALDWSPDGNWLAYAGVSKSGGASEIWAVEVTTGEQLQITDSGDPAVLWTPSWSPDGQKIALLKGWIGLDSSSFYPSLVVVDWGSLSSVEIELTEASFELGSPVVWSEWGNEVALVMSQDVATDVWIVDVDDHSVDKLTGTGDVSGVIRWTADDRQLLISTWDSIRMVPVPH